jgi:hypothetical protein
MTAATFGSVIAGGTQAAFAVLSDKRIVEVTIDGANYLANFFAPDGTPLGSSIILNPTGPDFTENGFVSTAQRPPVTALPNGGFAVLGENRNSGGATDYLASFDGQGSEG